MGNDIAAVVWNRETESTTIEFYESFANRQLDIAPLTMPLEDILRGERIFNFSSNRGKTFKGLPGMLADSLPDDYGNKILDEWFASKGMSISEFTPLDRLCYIGKRGMGALEYEPANNDKALNESSRIEIEQLMELARDVLNQREAFQANNQNHIIEITPDIAGVILYMFTSPLQSKPILESGRCNLL
jgi:hypothetical protein